MRAVRKLDAVWRWRALACLTWAWAAILVCRARPEPEHGPSAGAVSPARRAAPSPQLAPSSAVNVEASQDAPQFTEKSSISAIAQRLSEAPEAELARLTGALAAAGGLEAHAVLFRAANAARPGLKSQARSAIATLDTADARAFMLDALNDDEPTEAVSYFADCIDARAVPKLEVLVRSADTELRQAAVTALFAQGEAGRFAITRLLADDDTADIVLQTSVVTTEAQRLLRTASIARLRRGGVSSGPVFDVLAHDLSSQGLSALAQAARDEATAGSAIDALQARGDAAALSLLGRLASTAPNATTDRAACALVAAADSRSRAYLARTSERLRRETTAALLRIDAPEASGFLARLRASADESDREAAARLASEYELRL